MMFLKLSVLPLLLVWPFAHGHPRIETFRSRVGLWRIEARRDIFSGQLSCQLARGRVTYQRGALIFNLASKTDTSNAIYRVDGGVAIAARTLSMSIARLGLPIYADDLQNPSRGWVQIPAVDLSGAHEVSVEPYPRARITRFRIDGFSSALSASAALGCTNRDFT